MSQRRSPTDAGEMNRETSERIGREKNSGTAEFGQQIGRSENLEDGRMGEQSDDDTSRIGEVDPGETSGGFGTATGRSGSFGNRGGGGANISREEAEERERSGEPNGNIGRSSEGRH